MSAQVPAQRSLVELEAVVERGLVSFIEVGEALMEIRAQKLYLETHATFREYCEQRWGFSDSRGRQLIAAAKTVTAVTVAGLPAPKTEGEARQLARALRDADRLEQHPLVRGLLPGIEGDRWDSFVASVRKWGILHPIILYEGMILDGWQRYRASRITGAPFATRVYEGDDPLLVFVEIHVYRKDYTQTELDRVMGVLA